MLLQITVLSKYFLKFDHNTDSLCACVWFSQQVGIKMPMTSFMLTRTFVKQATLKVILKLQLEMNVLC